MAWYRMYFLGDAGDIRNVDEFEAPGDDMAITLASNLHYAVRDLYHGYEVWQQRRRVIREANSTPSFVRPVPDPARLSQAMQESLLKREEILHASKTAFSRSLTLLTRMAELRNELGLPPPRKKAG